MPKGSKFSICIANPPYNNGLHEKFLTKFLDISEQVVSIQPASWLLAKKKNKKICDKLNKVYCNIETVNGNNVFDAGFTSNLCIIKTNSGEITETIFDGEKFNNIYDIEIINDKLFVQFKHIILPLANKQNLLDNLLLMSDYKYMKHNNRDINLTDDSWIIRQVSIRGHISANGKADDFYTIISNNDEFLKNSFYGKFKDMKKISGEGRGALNFYYAFNNKSELFNFINYLKTDFVRSCLYLIKTSTNLMRGELKYIPWFDFSDSHFSKSPREIDDWLFKKYNISDEIRKHIEEILPDYYNIRK